MAVSTLRVTALLLGFAAASDICSAQAIPTTASGHFEALDRNHDGVVSKHEYNSDSLFSAIDSDHNNRVSAKELQVIFGPQSDGQLSVADRIQAIDSNTDGELTDEEFRRGIELRLRTLDTNKDDYVDLAEFKSGFGRP